MAKILWADKDKFGVPPANLFTSDDANEVKESVNWLYDNVTTTANVVINVRDYGAVGDGVTDDTAAIQAAIDYVYGLNGGTVNIDRGVYRCRDVELKESVNLVGQGPSTSKLRFITSGDLATDATSWVINWTGAFTHIEGITVDGQLGGGLFSIGNGIRITYGSTGVQNYSRSINNCVIEYFRGYNASPVGGNYGIGQEYAANDIRNPSTGVFNLIGGFPLQIPGANAAGSNFRITNCRIMNCDNHFNIGRLNDSFFHNIQIAHITRAPAFLMTNGNANNHISHMKVFLSGRLNVRDIGVAGARNPIIPYRDNVNIDSDNTGAVHLTGCNHYIQVEVQECGTHGFRIGIGAYALRNSILDLIADGNGGYIYDTVDPPVDNQTLRNQYLRNGVVLFNYYNINMRLVADDLRAKFSLGRQLYGIKIFAPINRTSLSELSVGETYYIASTAGGADFTPLQPGYTFPKNTAGDIFQAQAPGDNLSLDPATNFGTGGLQTINSGLQLNAVIVNQQREIRGLGVSYDVASDRGLNSVLTINGVTI